MKNFLFLFAVLFSIIGIGQAQECLSGGCSLTGSHEYPVGPFTPSTSWATKPSMNAGNWTRFNVTSGITYEWTYCEAYGGVSTAWDAQLTLRNYSSGAILCHSDDVCGTNSDAPYIRWTANFTGVVQLLTSVYPCGINTVPPYNRLAYRQVAASCAAPSAPTSCTNSIGTPANGLEHHISQTWTAVSEVTGYEYQSSWDGVTYFNGSTYQTTSTSAYWNLGDLPNQAFYTRVRAYKCSPVQYSSWTYGSTNPIYTACDVPATLTVNSPTSSSLNVTLNTESPVANPGTTTYAIVCSTTSQYVQSNGTLGSSPYYQTKSGWGTKTITGLTGNTSYCFYAHAKNTLGDLRNNATNSACATTTSSLSIQLNTPELSATTITLGQSFVVTSSAKNTGTGMASSGGVTIQVWEAFTNGVEVTEIHTATGASTNKSVWWKGEQLGTSHIAKYLHIEPTWLNWNSNVTNTVTSTITPKKAGTYNIYTKCYISNGTNYVINALGSTSNVDHQNQYTYKVGTVTVTDANNSPDIELTPSSITINQKSSSSLNGQSSVKESAEKINSKADSLYYNYLKSNNLKFGTGLIVPDSVKKYWGIHETPVFKSPPTGTNAIVDWSSQDSPVKNQFGCGSCWAFAAIGLIENLGTQTDLSEQAIVSCNSAGDNCNGGWQWNALAYVQSVGVPPESCYPYTVDNGNCSNLCSDPPFRERVTSFDPAMGLWGEIATVADLKSILNNGPAVVTMHAPPGSFNPNYSGGVYDYNGGPIPFGNFHAVLCIGYDDNQQCFFAKNSWGTTWGINESKPGYFRIAYDDVTDDVHFGGYAVQATGVYTQNLSENSFTISNIGNGNLSINSISDNKNWLSTSGFPSTPFNITEGGSQIFNVSVDWNLVGSTSQTGIISITSNDPDEPSVTVSVTANPLPSAPVIQVSVGTLPSFGDVEIGSNSLPQSYTVSGSNLTTNISIVSPTGFKVSSNASSGYSNSLTLTQSGGTVASTPIYVRFSPTTLGLYSGNITHSSIGAIPQNVTVSGTGICSTPATPTASVTIQPTCAVPNGTIVITAPVGTQYEYQLDAGAFQASATFIGVAVGNHTVKARMAASPTCISSASTSMTVNAVPAVPATPIASVTVQPTCAVPTGTIVITVPLGAQYEYQLDAGAFQASATFTGVAVGNHTVKARLAASPTCISSASTSMTVNAVPAVPAIPSASVTVQPTCAVSTGTIVITVPLGAQYEYQLDAGAFQASATFTGVAVGNHTVKARLTASPTCVSSASTSMTVNAGPAMPATPTASVTVQPTCAVSTGTIVVTAPLGAQYEYQLDAGAYQASATFTGVAVGNHTVKARLTASPTCVSSASLTILPPDCNAFSEYLFEESSGLTVIDSKGSNNGTIMNNVVRVTGVRGGGLKFTGSGYVNLGHSFGENVQNEVTLSAWIKPIATTGSWKGIIMHGGVNIDTYALYINPDSKGLGFATNGTSNSWFTIDNVNYLWDGNWHFVAVTYNGAEKIIYVDNVALIKIDATGKIESGQGYNLLIGAGRDTDPPTLFYDGLMDEARVYNYALTNTQIGDLYKLVYPNPDTTPPMITLFTIPATSSSLTVPVSLTATDNIGVTGYKLTETSVAPNAGDAGWIASAQTSYTFATEGTKTLFAWVKDVTGNVSLPGIGRQVVITLPSSNATLGNTEIYTGTSAAPNRRALPVTFTEAGTIQSISIYHNGGTGNVLLGVYSDMNGSPTTLLQATSITAVNFTPGWQTVSLASPVNVALGQKVWLAWVFQNSVAVRYTAGTPGRVHSSATWSSGMPATFGAATSGVNIFSIYCTYKPGIDITKPIVTAFTIPATSSSLMVPVSSFTATDNIAVTGYILTETSVAPNTGDAGWAASAQTSFTFTTEGTKTLFAWAKDAAGNVSSTSMGNQVVITLPKLGNTDVFSLTSVAANRRALPVTFTEAGIIQSISIYHNGGTGNVLLGVYSDMNGSPTTLLQATAITAVNSTGGWQTVSLSSPVKVALGQKVWLAWVFQNSVAVRYTAGTPGRVHSSATWSSGMPASFGAATSGVNIFSIYCTYTVDGTKSAEIATVVSKTSNDEFTFKAYPNPFTDKLNIEFSNLSDTRAKLEIFNIAGSRLEILFNGPINGGELYTVEYLPKLVSSQIVLYHLTMNGKTQVGKLIYNETR